MAKNKCTVLLGYDDEPIADRDKPFLSHAVNKIGGTPNWPASEIAISPCPLCGQTRPLILQIYAPLENSQFHRTLYIFACLNAPCSAQSSSWFCVRTQSLEKSPGCGVGDNYEQVVKSVAAPAPAISWCSGADEWGDDEEEVGAGGGDGTGDTVMRVDTGCAAPDENDNEENGNVIRWDANKISDEEEESNSLENDPVPGFGDLRVDERNANADGHGARGGLIDNLYTSKVTAEIEATEEDGVVTVETPVTPKRDLIALLKQPQIISREVRDLTLKSFYINVDEERSVMPAISDHVRELLNEYQKHEDVKTSPDSPLGQGGGAVGGQQPMDAEMYEKGVPAHGDLMFHNFMTKLQENPGQILRYSRTAAPLLIAPLKELVVPPLCQHCKQEMICEIQILPTLIEKLRLEATGQQVPIDFGNVLVWTCVKSCWDTPDRMRAEMVLVQQES